MDESCWNYDLFVSFYGYDSRTSFLDHLYTALSNTRCRIFRDDNMKKGMEISPTILKAIKESKISIIVFSKNYPQSTYCLQELVQILECREANDQKVLPLFHKVDSAHVHALTHSYADAFATHETNYGKVQVDEWRAKVQKAANIVGIDGKNKLERVFIEEVVEHVIGHLKRNLCVVNQPHVDSSSRLAKLNLQLGMGTQDARMIVIWGDEGIGKTTIAKLLYNSILSEFNYFCFLENVGSPGHKSQEDPNGILRLQNEILQSMSLKNNVKAEKTGEGRTMILKLCMLHKVLVVIDGVDELPQIEGLGMDSYGSFAVGSRIIVTTRDHKLFDNFQQHYVHKYETTKFNHEESLELLRQHVLRKVYDDELHYLSTNLVWHARGVPSAITELGTYLKGKTNKEWNRTVGKLRKVPPGEILEFLRKINEEDDDDEEDNKNIQRQNVASGSSGGEGGEQ